MDYKAVQLPESFNFLQVAGEVVRNQPYPAVLLSGVNPPHGHPSSPQSVWNIIAWNPVLVFRSKGPYCEFEYGTVTCRAFGNPWTIFESRFSQFELPVPQGLEFPLGAAIGYFGYDMKNSAEPGLPQSAQDDLESDDCHLGFYSTLIVQKKSRENTSSPEASFLIVTGHDAQGNTHPSLVESRIEDAMDFIGRCQELNPEGEISSCSQNVGSAIESSLTEGEFVNAVVKSKEWIRQGHIYQVNLSQRLKVRSDAATGHRWQMFQSLIGPDFPEYSGYIQTSRMTLMSGSPELFLSMNGDGVLTSPIKGTRPRHAEPEKDHQLLVELTQNPKEMAELTMITDLLRNDIGRVSRYGSVKVPEFLVHKSLPHVHHMYSSVTGRLNPGVTHLGALRRCFPGGSITGAPKIRAMEIIDELEPVTRGPYTGAMGYLGFNQTSQFNIIIRSAYETGGFLYFPVGAGIVADSDPQKEYEETWHKARSFLHWLQASREDSNTETHQDQSRHQEKN